MIFTVYHFMSWERIHVYYEYGLPETTSGLCRLTPSGTEISFSIIGSLPLAATNSASLPLQWRLRGYSQILCCLAGGQRCNRSLVRRLHNCDRLALCSGEKGWSTSINQRCTPRQSSNHLGGRDCRLVASLYRDDTTHRYTQKALGVGAI